ncbi:MAG: PDZ domain-containing protein, partial [Pirellula sp.]|nr:PDZ domain-containing protein [Pirellula sp.]
GKAGLQANDLITKFDGSDAKSWEEIVGTISSKKAGDKIKVSYERSGETKELELVLEDRPAPVGAPAPQPTSRVYLGIQGQTASAGGAQLTEITKDGPAEKAGLVKGDVIKSLNGKPVESYRAVTEMLRDAKVGDKVKLQVARATEVKEFEIELVDRPGPTRPYSANLGGQAANVQDQQGAKGFEYGGVYKSTDGGESWMRVNSIHQRPMYFSVIRVDPNDDKKVYLLGVSQSQSMDGGLTFDSNLGRGVHADGHALWIDPKDGKHMIIGVDGGVYTTYDRGNRWDHLNTMALGQFYHVAISPKYPYYVYGGLQDNGTWGGPSMSLSGGGPVNEDWLSVGGGDGFMCRVDQNDPDLVYWTSQNGAMGRRNMKTGERGSIRPRTVEGQPAYRFNWNTPFILSNANSRVFYAAGNYVFRSLDRGNNLEKISPEITLTKRGSATALSESPLDSNVLYVGTDDGALWVTKDGGKSWNEIGKGLNLPAPRWVATVEASRFAAGRVYISLDGHRSNDDEPYAFVSEDYGTTWKSIRSNLPWGSTRCLRESPFNENVLLVGTEFAVFASADRGATWNSLNTNLPTVPVFDFAFHPNNGEVVAATHGRSLWIADITPLHQFSAQQMEAAAHLYKPTTAIRWRREPSRGGTNRSYAGENPPSGAILYYSLSKKAKEAVVRIANAEGATIREIRGPIEPGLHRVAWDLISSPPQRGGRGEGAAGGRGEGTARRGAGGGGGFGGRATAAPSGTYKVTLSVDGKDLSQELRLVSDPNVTALGDLLGAEADYDVWFGDVEEEEEEEEEENEGVQSGLRERIRD